MMRSDVIAGIYLGIFFIAGMTSVTTHDPSALIIELVAALQFFRVAGEIRP